MAGLGLILCKIFLRTGAYLMQNNSQDRGLIKYRSLLANYSTCHVDRGLIIETGTYCHIQMTIGILQQNQQKYSDKRETTTMFKLIWQNFVFSTPNQLDIDAVKG